MISMQEVMEKDTKSTHKLNDLNNACKLLIENIQMHIQVYKKTAPNPKGFFFIRIIYFRYPSAPCSYIDANKLASQCLQKHNFVRLLAYTYDIGLHIDSFKMPVACSCHIRGPPKHYG